MAEARPFSGTQAMIASADAIWWTVGRQDWLEAFAAHPEIGAGGAGGPGRADATRAERTSAWSDEEQAGVAVTAEQTRRRLADANRDYRARFGHIFIVCATGRTGDEMLALLEARLRHDPADELRASAQQQREITQLRLTRLLEQEPDTP